MTTSLRWVDAFSLHNSLLDRAHLELFDLVGAAITAVQAEHPKDAVCAIEALSQAALQHFDHEDRMMRDFGYPRYYNHLEQHRCLILGLEKLQIRLALRKPDHSLTVRELRSWFSLHLLNDDQWLSSYIDRAQV